MLVLSRKRNEEIKIGENISIKVLGVEGGKVRLGITAPDDVLVLREELKNKAEDVLKRQKDDPSEGKSEDN